jgi:hypothetical protein
LVSWILVSVLGETILAVLYKFGRTAKDTGVRWWLVAKSKMFKVWRERNWTLIHDHSFYFQSFSSYLKAKIYTVWLYGSIVQLYVGRPHQVDHGYWGTVWKNHHDWGTFWTDSYIFMVHLVTFWKVIIQAHISSSIHFYKFIPKHSSAGKNTYNHSNLLYLNPEYSFSNSALPIGIAAGHGTHSIWFGYLSPKKWLA